MHLIKNSLLPVALAIIGAAASPTPAETPAPSRTASGLLRHPDVPDLFVQHFEAGELVTDPSYSTTVKLNEVPVLGKREHAQCWDNHLTTRANQEAYEDDCDRLVDRLSRSSKTQLLHPGQSVQFQTAQQRCKIIVRNESRCNTKIVYDTSAGIGARDTLNSCARLTSCSGWGHIGNSPGNYIIYLVEPSQVAPPAYSPRC